MPVNPKYLEPFEEDSYHHVYFKCGSRDWLFESSGDRLFFLKRFRGYIRPYASTLCYSLLDNHAHWLIKTKTTARTIANLGYIPDEYLKNHQKKLMNGSLSFDRALEYQFKDLFISYAKNFNLWYNRTGALFINPFRRLEVKDDMHLSQLIIYIHANALKHQLVDNFELYPWSSFQDIRNGSNKNVHTREVLDWFGGMSQFLSVHRDQVDYYYSHPLALEM